MCTARLFSQGFDLFALKFYLDRVVPHQPFLAPDNQRHWATARENTGRGKWQVSDGDEV